MPEAVIIDAIRTPIGALGGMLASMRPDDMAALVLKALTPEDSDRSRNYRRSIYGVCQPGW